jgi:hypothetical protein
LCDIDNPPDEEFCAVVQVLQICKRFADSDCNKTIQHVILSDGNQFCKGTLAKNIFDVQLKMVYYCVTSLFNFTNKMQLLLEELLS